jgi:hypothetical protein
MVYRDGARGKIFRMLGRPRLNSRVSVQRIDTACPVSGDHKIIPEIDLDFFYIAGA